MTGQGAWRHDRGMDLPAPLAWLVDEAGASPGPDRFLAELGGRLLGDGIPLAGGALTLAVPHPIIARRTWLWRAQTGEVIEALGFAGGTRNQTERDWLARLGPVQEDTVGLAAADNPVLGWAGTRPFGPAEVGRLRQGGRFGAGALRTLGGGGAGGRRWQRGSRPILVGAVPLVCRPARCAAAAGRPSTPRCFLPICATSRPSPRRPSPQ